MSTEDNFDGLFANDPAEQAQPDIETGESSPEETLGETLPEESEPETQPLAAKDKASATRQETKAAETEEMVPLKALVAERRKFQEQIEQQRRESEELTKKIDEYFAKRDAKPEPTFHEDPEAYINYQKSQLEKQLQDLRDQQKSVTEYQRQQDTVNTVQKLYGASTQRFAKDHADFDEALGHIRNIERQKLKPFADAQGLDDDALAKIIEQNEFNAAYQLLSQGIDPANYFYSMAKTYGFAGGAKQKMDVLEKGIKASKSLGSGSSEITKDDVDDDAAGVNELNKAFSELFGVRMN